MLLASVRSFSALVALVLGVFFSVSFSEVPLASAAGCTWSKIAYVDSAGGVDQGPTVCHGTTSSNAYRTIAAALAARDYKYSGQNVTIYYKGGSQTLNNTGFDNNVVLRPWGSSTSNARFTVSGPQTIKIMGFGFELGGGVTVGGTSQAVTVDGNSFVRSNIGVEISGASKVTVSNNLFEEASIYAHDVTEMVTVTNNTFKGAAPYSYASENWFVVASKLTDGFYFLTNRVFADSGNALYVEDSEEVNLTANEVIGAGSGSKAFLIDQSEGTYIDRNKLSNIQTGIVLLNGGAVGSASHFYAVNDNQIELLPGVGYASPFIGIDISAYEVENLSKNNVINGNHGFRIVNGSVVNSIEFNAIQTTDYLSVDLEAEGSVVNFIQNNLFVGGGTNIHFVDTTFTEIANNAIWAPYYGIILEHADGDLFAWITEQIRVENPGVLSSTAGSIHDNDFYKSELAIGMASYGVKDIYSNRFRQVHDGFFGYYSGVEKFRNNNLEHDGGDVPGQNGVELYGSLFGEVSGNSFMNFSEVISLDGVSQISGNLSSNKLGGALGLVLNNGAISGAVFNNLFVTTNSAITTSGSVRLQGGVINNTFYGQNQNVLNFSGTFSDSVAVVNNVFSKYSEVPVYIDTLNTLSILDSNLYGEEGGSILRVIATDYKLADLQARFMELNGYEESSSSLVDPVAGDFHLSMNSLGVNSADSTYAPSVDFEGTSRPVCTKDDRGADEISSSVATDNNDDDGDELCNFQETAWSTNPLEADTDEDLISDKDEIYLYRTTATSGDTDGDGYSDGDEILIDETDPLDATSHGEDLDHDGLPDSWEDMYGFDVNSSDSDGDGVLDADEDGDQDGLSNLQEYNVGTDPTQADADADSLNDGEELAAGTDPALADTDSDGLLDGYEVDYGFDPLAVDSGDDSDGDGLSNLDEYGYGTLPNNEDSDGDTMSDGFEILYGLDVLADDSALDLDNDGLTNLEEYVLGTYPNNVDSDGDFYTDFEEVTAGTLPMDAGSYPDDSDHDGMDDTWEAMYGLDPSRDDAASDLDSDGLTNLQEYTANMDPNDFDMDDDGLNDGLEVSLGSAFDNADSDADGLPDLYEYTYGLNLFVNDAASDFDSDGLTNLEEFDYGMLPNNEDTDGDTMNDGFEILYGLDALVDDRALDLDNDTLTNLEEYVLGTYPNNLDSDGDGFSDGIEVTAGTLPMDPSDYPLDRDADGLDDAWEISYVCMDASVADASEDDDLDGLSALQEYEVGTNPCESDTDFDGLSDGTEVNTSGTDPLDADADGDALNDSVELTYGTDTRNADTDSDLLSDADEIYLYFTDATLFDTDSDALSDGEEVSRGTEPGNSDTDLDGLLDGEEVTTYGTDPLLEDSDLDGFSDYAEVVRYGTDANDASDYPHDADADGLSDDWEALHSCVNPSVQDASGDTDVDELTNLQEYLLGTDPCLADTDGDERLDGDEVNTLGTDPLNSDTDSDGLNDGEEEAYGADPLLEDSDSDGLSDGDEVSRGTEPSNSDTDADGLSDGEEVNSYGTDPFDSDSDDDGFSDNAEVDAGWSPLDPSSHPPIVDTDSDGLNDVDETNGTYGYITDPYLIDTDSDTLTDGDEIFVYFTDPTTNDTDGDLFSDAYEVNQGIDALDPMDLPSLTVELTAYQEIYGSGEASSWSYTAVPYTSTTSATLTSRENYWFAIRYLAGTSVVSNGGFGVSFNRQDYLGEVEVTFCGSSSVAFDPTSYTSCTSISTYSSTMYPNTTTTRVESEAQLDVWPYLSAYYTFSDWTWYRPQISYVTRYSAYKIGLLP